MENKKGMLAIFTYMRVKDNRRHAEKSGKGKDNQKKNASDNC